MLCGIKGLRGSLSATNARTDGSTRLRTVSMQRTVPPSTTSAAARGRPARLVGVLGLVATDELREKATDTLLHVLGNITKADGKEAPGE